VNKKERKVGSQASPRLSAQVIVVGAGVAGATAAAVLGQKGWRVLLLDARSACPPVFKAEKVERDELRLLNEFGLLDRLLQRSTRIFETYAAYNGRIFRSVEMEHLGIKYADLVNTLRSNLPGTVGTKIGRVNRISRDGETMRAHLDGGEMLTARLVVVACGIGGSLLASLGLRRRVIQKEQCIGLGFDLVASNCQPFPFQGVTYYSTDAATCIDYITPFKICDTMRANLFVFRPGNDPWIRQFHREPRLLLTRALPGLSRVIGEYDVKGKVVSGRVDLYRTKGDMPDGVVFVGDALQNACPSTGLGFKKVFADVAVLAECVPAWFSTPGMSAEKLRSFYDHPRKRSTDSLALKRGHHQRHAAIDPSLRWRLHRALLHLKWNLSRPAHLPSYFRQSMAAPVKEFEYHAEMQTSTPAEWEEVAYEKK
jgi:2-polyprenyl-6-methoxyphenol hydroxylase-like FAD-dependent oxidoreductase